MRRAALVRADRNARSDDRTLLPWAYCVVMSGSVPLLDTPLNSAMTPELGGVVVLLARRLVDDDAWCRW